MSHPPHPGLRITAGWGPYPGHIPPALTLNTTRIITWLDCEREATYRFILNRERDRLKSQALQIGTLWHSVVEAIQSKAKVPDAKLLAEQAAAEADEAGLDNMAKDLRKFALMVEPAIEVYTRLYANGTPTGITLAVEQEFWLLLEFPPDFPVLLRGCLDKVGYTPEKGLINGECKTVSASEDMARYVTERSKHLQDQLYFLALYYAPIPAEWHQKAGCEIPLTPYGTVYDLFSKKDYPQKASHGFTVEERIAQWERSIFYTQAVHFNLSKCMDAVEEVYQVARRWGGPYLPNRRACRDYQNIRCDFYDTCYRDTPLSSTYYRDREPDYVDEVNRHA